MCSDKTELRKTVMVLVRRIIKENSNVRNVKIYTEKRTSALHSIEGRQVKATWIFKGYFAVKVLQLLNTVLLPYNMQAIVYTSRYNTEHYYVQVRNIIS
jgi:hypothetical protein